MVSNKRIKLLEHSFSKLIKLLELIEHLQHHFSKLIKLLELMELLEYHFSKLISLLELIKHLKHPFSRYIKHLKHPIYSAYLHKEEAEDEVDHAEASKEPERAAVLDAVLVYKNIIFMDFSLQFVIKSRVQILMKIL